MIYMRIGKPNKDAVNLLVNAYKYIQGDQNVSCPELEEIENIIKEKGVNSEEVKQLIENFTVKNITEKYPGAYVKAQLETIKGQNKENIDAVMLLVNAYESNRRDRNVINESSTKEVVSKNEAVNLLVNAAKGIGR